LRASQSHFVKCVSAEISILGQNLTFRRKLDFITKNSMFDQKVDFGQKFDF